MPRIVNGLYFGYGPVMPAPDARDWRSETLRRALAVWAFAALIATTIICARYGF